MEQKKASFLSIIVNCDADSRCSKQNGQFGVCLSPREPKETDVAAMVWGHGDGGLPSLQTMCHLLCAPQNLRGWGNPLSPLGLCTGAAWV